VLECSSKLESLELELVQRLEHLLRIELLVSESRFQAEIVVVVVLASEPVDSQRFVETSDLVGACERQCCVDSEPLNLELRGE